mgnify:FL=1
MRINIETTLRWAILRKLYWSPSIVFYRWGVNGIWLMYYFNFQITKGHKHE